MSKIIAPVVHAFSQAIGVNPYRLERFVKNVRSLGLGKAPRSSDAFFPDPDKSKQGKRMLLLAFFDSNSPKTVLENIFEIQRISKYPVDIFNYRFARESHFQVPFESGQYSLLFCHCTLTYNLKEMIWLLDLLDLGKFAGHTIVMKQDESRYIDDLVVYLKSLGKCLLLTCVPEGEIEKVYPRAKLPEIQFLFTLTGYVTEEMRLRVSPPLAERLIDVSYRGSMQPYVFGQLCYEKAWIADAFLQATKGMGLNCDISSRWEDRLYGEAWDNLLMRSRAVLGVESGASVFDFDGSLEKKCNRYKFFHPDCTFKEVQEKFLLPYEGNVRINQISPRHFEAAANRCVQILFEGDYSGIFQAGRHYLSLKRDFSNINEVTEALSDTVHCQQMVDTAFEEVILNPRWHYATFVKDLDVAIDRLLAE